jgi:thymidine phosphorylase
MCSYNPENLSLNYFYTHLMNFTTYHLHFEFSASIISKKVAEGTKTLVMDVKVGEAAFFKNEDEARTLASMLVS